MHEILKSIALFLFLSTPTFSNACCHYHRELTDRSCRHLASNFNCYSSSDVRCMRQLDTIQSTHVLSGENLNHTFYCHRVEIEFYTRRTGSKITIYRLVQNGAEGNYGFMFNIDRHGTATQLYDGATSWTPFAYTCINGVNLFLQCYGDQLQYTDIMIGVDETPTDDDYARAEEVLACLRVPRGIQRQIAIPKNAICDN